MKLYYHPMSTTSRPVVQFAADAKLSLDLQVVDLFTGEHMQPAYAEVNPSRLVPTLEDGSFRLTESSAILKYLAEKAKSPAYPGDLQKRARVNERMDWLNTQFYRDFGYGLLYPQLFPHLKRPTEEQQAGTVAWGKEKSAGWLQVLDQAIIGPKNDYLCGGELTVADYFGAGLVTVGDLVRCNFAQYPNISRWLGRMKAMPSWPVAYKPFYDFAATLKEQPFVAL